MSRRLAAQMCPEMQRLAAKLPEVIEHSRASNTVKKYRGAFDGWSRWAAEQSVVDAPADSLHVALYLIKLLESARTAAPVTAAVYGISWFHISNGMADPCTVPVVERVHQAARRILAKPRNRKAPLNKEILERLGRELNRTGSLKDLQTLALIVLGYAALLRWDDLSHVYVDDLRITKKYMTVFLEGRKNDQLRHGQWVFISRWKSELCPVALVEELLRRGGHSGHVPLFGRIRNGKRSQSIRGAMSYHRAREILLEAFARIGEEAGKFGLHSLRSGGASVAAALGLPERLIQRQGGWRCESSMKSYIKESLPSMLAVSRALEV